MSDGLLRIVTCGSVDDGKSSLVGRLLFDLGLIPDDYVATLAMDSRNRPCGPEGLDLSLLVDGLSAEREQGITIDIAYRHMSTPARRILLADSPGHEQYTRNMATAASDADAAILLVDARKGILEQTRRHAAILSLMRVRHVALAVNKMDLVGNDDDVFRGIAQSFAAFARELALSDVTALPVSALSGANVARRDGSLGWHTGPTLLEWIEAVPSQTTSTDSFHMPVQWVNRAGADFRGLSGRVISGRLRVGDRIASARSGRAAAVDQLTSAGKEVTEVAAGEAVTIVLAMDIDVGRGDVLFDPAFPPAIGDQFAATVVWFDDAPFLPHRSYHMQIGTNLVAAEVTALNHKLGLETLDKQAAKSVEANEICRCNFALAQPVAFTSYRESRPLGSFILIDRLTRNTVGAGIVEHPLRRAENVKRQTYDVTREGRALQMKQKPMIVWFTGLSGSGKSTVANLVDRQLHAMGRHSCILDGDNLRHGLNKDLGFTDVDRIENVRRAAEVAKLMADAGLIVLVALISPFRQERAMARQIAGDTEFIEVFIDASLATCEERDTKGLYAKARSGKLPNFTGISSSYEAPERPDLGLYTDETTPEACAEAVIARILWVSPRLRKVPSI